MILLTKYVPIGLSSQLSNVNTQQIMDNARPFLMGKAAAVINEKKSAKALVDELVSDAVTWIQKGEKMIAKL